MSQEVFPSNEERLQNVEDLVNAQPEIAGLQAYEYFRSNSASQKEKFIKDEVENLELVYSALSDERIAQTAMPALEALKQLMPGDSTDKSEALYRSIEYRYSELSMLYFAKLMNDPSLSDDERAEARDWFQATNEALYGHPSAPIFNALAHKHVTPVINEDYADRPIAKRIAHDLNGRIGKLSKTAYEPYEADPSTVSIIGNLIDYRFSKLLEHVDVDKTYDVEAIKEEFNIALGAIGGQELGWHADIVPNSSALAVSAHQRLVGVGENRKPLNGGKLQQRILHEVGIHALRSINAEKAGWLSAAYGQDGYLDFEEALALALEDAYTGKFENHGENHYLIAGFAYGLDNNSARDFRRVYEIIWRVNALNDANGSEITEEITTKAQSKAFTNCLRFFRGTTTRDNGVVYLKDLAYFRGQELAWSVLDSVKTQEDLDLILAGKLDLTRDDHRHIAEQILQEQ